MEGSALWYSTCDDKVDFIYRIIESQMYKMVCYQGANEWESVNAYIAIEFLSDLQKNLSL